MADRDTVTFRISRELREQLDALAERMEKETGIRANRSLVARTLIATSLSEDPSAAVLNEVFANIQHVLQWAISRVTRSVRDELPGLLDEGFGNLTSGRGLRVD